MLKIYGRRTSFNVQKGVWIAAEMGVPFQRIDVGGKFGGLNTPEFLALNPIGRIPVIDDGGAVIWESHAIVRYLAAKHGLGTWCPAGPVLRAQADQWMDWAATSLNVGFMGLFLDYFKVPPDKRDWTLIRKHQEACARDYGLLDRMLATRPFLMGEQITMADVYPAASLFRLYTLDVELPEFPHVAAWYERLKKRPAYAEHVMVDYAELRGY